ncbi:unnamed protein product [Phytophthora lilii]|uniref:Unnamed protein product n=1 Tax=Phytophthora lilii TaxID=2077276 RepID=A0A9W6U9L6_9STRA|nr:unnamed protein product [Phytophthora lilii]
MMFNTNTPYSSSFGTAPITLSSGNIYIKAFNALNDGTANYDMPIFMESSNASPLCFGLQLNNATNATSTNSAYFGTTTTNDLVLMTANTRRVTSFGGNIYIQAGIWATSDRRLKENIKEIDLPFERYKDLKPVSYSYKNEAKKRVGLIAQDVMRVCSEAITMIENQNLKDEGENSPEAVQLCLDYNAITILNVNIIKKLIDRVEQLESTIKRIVAFSLNEDSI